MTLADWPITYPYGIIEDVLVTVDDVAADWFYDFSFNNSRSLTFQKLTLMRISN